MRWLLLIPQEKLAQLHLQKVRLKKLEQQQKNIEFIDRHSEKFGNDGFCDLTI